ncbi:DHH family phosphoesterase [Wukongibacter sp. M2B1]|uniref:DHH family phosphoesterase n=1 Tax=Wukongibacter sp. M2B1 TaxID=3088895 RepID=UPI003D7914FA
MHNKLWSYFEYNNVKLQEFIEQLGISDITARLLLNRGINKIDNAKTFLNPELSQLHDPLLLSDMDKAVDRINRAIENHENLWLYGSDYIEGIISVVILSRYLMSIEYGFRYYIDDTIKQKSKIALESIDYIKSMGGDLIICSGCQVETNEIVEYAYSKNIDVIIIDNIDYKEDGPKSKAVINPRSKESTYPFKMLSCVGIALKLIQVLTRDEKVSKQFRDLDIVALGVFADGLPIIDENRVLAKIGLEVLPDTTNLGLRTFIQTFCCDNREFEFEDIPRTIAYLGHLSEKSDGESVIVKLLLSQSHGEAMEICKRLYSDFMTNNSRIEKYEAEICKIDMEIDVKDIGFNLIEEINLLRPFGIGNPKPLFSYSKITVESVTSFGKDEEDLKLLVQDENRIFDCIAPALAKANITLSKHEKIDLAFNLELSSFKDIEVIKLIIKDLRRRCEDAYRENDLIHSYYKSFTEKIRNYEYFTMKSSYRNIKDLRNIRDKARYVIDNLKSNNSNLILINTVDGFIDLFLLLSDNKNFELLDNISFNYPSSNKNSAIVVNPVLKNFNFEKYENIYLYDIPLFEEEVNILSEFHSTIHLLYNKDECKAVTEFFKDSIPTRDDLAELYKYLKAGADNSQILYQNIIKNLYKMNYPKLRIALNILSDAKLLNFSHNGEGLSLELLPPPKKKIDITATKLYTNICFLKDRFKAYTKNAFIIDFNKV